MSQSKPAIPDPREIAGRYEVEKRLGAGAFGTVYKARDRMLGRLVAIKTIRLEGLAASVASLDELLRRFEQEARNAARLKHPNIVTIYDIGEVEGLSYLSMEYIEGIGLDRILSETGKLSVGRAAALLAQVADALDFAHRHKVIHRDIKPANIMVEAGDQVKVTDFGIAKATDSGEHLTQTGGILGTPSYMSPEQARGHAVDGRSDLFSVGCVLYELLTGRKAFRGDSITAVLLKIIAEEPPPLREVDPLIPDEAVRIVKKALSKAPETRYQTGRELADDLLALAHPGYVPTLRHSETPTTGATPTLALDPTARGEAASPPTVASAPTQARPAAPPVPPTRVVPPPPGSPPPPPRVADHARVAPPSAAPVARPLRPPMDRRRTGGGTGRLLGLVAAGTAVVLLLGVGGWWALGRRAPAVPPDGLPPEATAVPTTTPAPEPANGTTTPATAAGSVGGTTPAASGSGPAAAPERAPEPPAASGPSAARQPPRPEGASAPPASDSRSPALPPRTAPPPPATPADAFLDDVPEDELDGRAAGEALAEKYRSGGSSGTTSTRFRRRPRIPPHGPAERPAVAALAWILQAEKAHHRKTGRYGTLGELVRSGALPMRQPPSGDGFDRSGYRFTVTASGDEFRAEARPLAPGGRAFYVDDAGFVLPDED